MILRLNFWRSRILLVTGIALSLSTAALYAFRPYSLLNLVAWVGSLLFTIAHFYRQESNESSSTPSQPAAAQRWVRADLYAALGIALLLAPLYVAFVYEYPVEVNTDEIVTMVVEKVALEEHPLDPVALRPGYFYFPTLAFALRAKLAQWMGGVTLYHMRLISGYIGVINIILAFLFFRLALPRLYALGATLVMCSNNGLIGISRMAVREDLAVLVELAAFIVLIQGYRKRSLAYSCLGGMLAGFAVHMIFPGRLTVMIWILFLGLAFLRADMPKTTRFRLAWINLLGIALVAMPVVVSTIRDLPQSTGYARTRLLWTKEGRELARTWSSGDPVPKAMLTNIKRGLSTFNSTLPDNANLYNNHGTNTGLLDPLTGALIWLGLIVLWVKRRQSSEFDLLTAAGFLGSWLLFSFFTNKAPAYTSLILVLPFTSYLALVGLQGLSKPLARYASFGVLCGVALIFVLNLHIFEKVIRHGMMNGHDVGDTGRFIESRNAQRADYAFFVLSDTQDPYLSWADSRYFLGFFTRPGQPFTVISPHAVLLEGRKPFVIFMLRKTWLQKQTELWQRYPEARLHDLIPCGNLVAMEVQ